MRSVVVAVATVALSLGVGAMPRADAANTCPGGTLSGVTINASVVIAAGQTCLIQNSSINGSVTATGAKDVDIITSKVNGPVTFDGSTNDDMHFDICGSIIGGAVTFRNNAATDTFEINFEDFPCATRTEVRGNLTMTNNKGDVGIEGPSPSDRAIVGGSLLADRNADLDIINTQVKGSATVTNNGGGDTPEISGNLIAGGLSCSGNEPDPVPGVPSEENTGAANAAASKSGECAGL